DEALAGASDIMAERIAEDEYARRQLRKLWTNRAEIDSVVVKGKETEGEKFKDYFDWVEPAKSAPSHRILAIFRGESEKILRVGIHPEEKEALEILERQFAFGKNHPCLEYITLAIKDSFKRLLAPSMESEMRAALKERADLEAIEVFANNLRELLLSPPLGESRIMAVDPGFRTGCKIVCLSASGELLHNDVIYLHKAKPGSDPEQAKILELAKRFQTETIAIGNGTASRESEEYLRSIDFSKVGLKPTIIVVNESGASIYSASDVAREEFPDHDITVRGAVSIGRRTLDPLAELVKIDPKSIGVGQYQHDVCQKSLQKSLDDTVISCVNSVGVELNTASKELLSYVSGLGKQLATNIVKHRQEVGTFKSRSELKKVPRLGAKAFEQCAGFLRIRGGAHPLDASAVHPERYELVERMAKDVGATVPDLMQKPELRKKIDTRRYLDQAAGLGLPTLQDILVELAKPGRDPREKLEPMRFADGISKMEDLKNGMRLPGIVTNVTAFGAFVDVGVHQDGLVHVSELADRFVKDPKEVVKVNQRVQVTVLSVDQDRKRIALSMKR
ncbi:MAG: helix-hairpin-helix domain-containing protein, partial [Cyanobacteria bacterium]|nr:helix-hairpin-helix domain-containing protein [Cyanobacteriota bacterium]